MSNKFSKVSLILLFLCLLSTFCDGRERQASHRNKNLVFVNPSHLNNLYQEIAAGGKEMAIIHIYSDYPGYKWTDAAGEGIACIDDVARAALFYSNYYKATGEKIYLRKIKKLIEYVLFMQAENGYFYNFITKDYSKNREYKTSLAQPDWWSWRAAWSLSETYKLFSFYDPPFSKRIIKSLDKLFSAIKINLPVKKIYTNVNGFERPAWLQSGTGADQSSILILAIVNYLELKPDPVLKIYLTDLCDGIIRMQEGGGKIFPYYAFLSWENLWHAYGNSQSYALLKAYELTGNPDYRLAVLREIDNFYPYLLREKFFNNFLLKKENGSIIVDEQNRYPQIAYGMRPLIFASLEASKITGKREYAVLAGELCSWFFGNNIAAYPMFDVKSGRCCDGINGKEEINKNSGAESTIEALLSILAVERNSTARSVLKRFMERK